MFSICKLEVFWNDNKALYFWKSFVMEYAFAPKYNKWELIARALFLFVKPNFHNLTEANDRSLVVRNVTDISLFCTLNIDPLPSNILSLFIDINKYSHNCKPTYQE